MEGDFLTSARRRVAEALPLYPCVRLGFKYFSVVRLPETRHFTLQLPVAIATDRRLAVGCWQLSAFAHGADPVPTGSFVDHFGLAVRTGVFCDNVHDASTLSNREVDDESYHLTILTLVEVRGNPPFGGTS
jgi:hypothetical protein